MMSNMGFKKRGFYVLIIGFLILLFASLFLNKVVVSNWSSSGVLIVKPDSINYTQIPVRMNSNVTYKLRYNTTTTRELNVTVYLAYGENPYEPVVKLDNITMGRALGIKKPGSYLLVVTNNGDKTIAANYTITVYYKKVVEEYGSATSITGIIVMLAGLFLIYNDIVSYYSKKYPDIIQKGPVKCSSIKLNKHVCTVETPIIDVEEAKELTREYMGSKDYRVRKDLGLGLILERSRINPFSKDKPALVTIDYYQLPIISITYTIPHSRASGSIDLQWIYKEVEEFLKYLVEEEKRENNNVH